MSDRDDRSHRKVNAPSGSAYRYAAHLNRIDIEKN